MEDNKGLVGQCFGALTVLRKADEPEIYPSGQKGTLYICRCEACGREVSMSYSTVIHSKSCGCQRYKKPPKPPQKWSLVTPENEVIEVENLEEWAQNNYALFEPETDDVAATVRRIVHGFSNISATLLGRRADYRKTYKGWSLLSPATSETPKKMATITRACTQCGKKFEAVKQQRQCPECREANRRKASGLHPRVCVVCGVTFDGGPRASYCPECRSERKKQTKASYQARKAMGNVRAIGSTDVCVKCGNQYSVESGLQKYCKACAPDAIATKRRELGRKWSAKFRAENPDYKKDLIKNSSVCPICGKVYTRTTYQWYCSPECAETAKRRSQQKSEENRKRQKVPPDKDQE